MKKLMVIGGSYEFINTVHRIFEITSTHCEIETDEQAARGSFYEYVVLESGCTSITITMNSSYCFINMDNAAGTNINIYGTVITYGFGSKNTVTISSADNKVSSFVYCLQRYLNHNAFAMLQPEEIPISLQGEFDLSNDDVLYACMVSATVAFLESSDVEQTKNKLIRKK
jgi:hypothetical protein